jgi:hypothetical protein
MKSKAVVKAVTHRGFTLTAIRAGIFAVAAQASIASAATFSFAGYSWDQDKTPDILGLIGGGVNLGGAQFSGGFPTHITRSVGFQNSNPSGSANTGFTALPGYDHTLTLGVQANTQHSLIQTNPVPNSPSLFSSAINLPAGNDGSLVRHGISITWSGGRSLANGPGDEFLIYESGSNATSSEGQMVRVRITGDGYSMWYYRAVDSFQAYSQLSPQFEGAFATSFDLSSLGLAPNTLIDQIQIANLQPGDRINTVGAFAASGQVVFSDPTNTLARPSVGNLAGMNPNSTFAAGAFDPDPLYIAITGSLIPEPTSAAMLAVGALLLVRRSRRTGLI